MNVFVNADFFYKIWAVLFVMLFNFNTTGISGLKLPFVKMKTCGFDLLLDR